jgi:hypothetical protein
MMVMNDSWRERFHAALRQRIADVGHNKEATVLIFRDVGIVIHKDAVCGVADAVK